MQMLSLGPGVDTLMQIKIGSARLRGMGLLSRLWRNAGGPPTPQRLHGAFGEREELRGPRDRIY